MKLKVKGNKLPSKGRHYFSEEPISELFMIIDEIVKYDAVRCDCDNMNRCCEHKKESLVIGINGELKKRISEVFE